MVGRVTMLVFGVAILWATTGFTAAHLFFAAVTMAYILMAIRSKERDLPQFYRETYRRYLEGIPTVPIVLIERQSGLGPRASALQSPQPIPTIEYPGR
jgi:protein-S-isoprenylcysteine O-methyltransferase Ste14